MLLLRAIGSSCLSIPNERETDAPYQRLFPCCGLVALHIPDRALCDMQARPDEGHHHHMSYMGTNNGRRLQQGPPGTVPEDIASAEPDAAMTPMAAPGTIKILALRKVAPTLRTHVFSGSALSWD